MNGLELTKAAREDHPEMEIVIFSGYNDFSYAREAYIWCRGLCPKAGRSERIS